mmetsp:Transcript_15084/g.25533  ORF Transcript_15084/g.25533 Transcript_15084/m.25533 type:complete len:277 (-) Transcript_15084:999-1829(-)
MFISSRTAVLGVSWSSKIRDTAVNTGSETLYFLPSEMTAPAVATPSATPLPEPKICAKLSPAPSLTPTDRLRDKLTKHVSMMSPTPAGPDNVAFFAPIFSANQRISAQPCEVSAAIALFPSSKPSTIPAAIARTFFNAPAISTPTTSSEMLTRKQGDASKLDASRARFRSFDAATIIVGRPAISSTAKEGPERITIGCARSNVLSITSVIIWPVPISRPLLRQRMGTSAGIRALTPSRKLRLDWTGIACTMYCASAIASVASVVALTFFGRSMSGK